MRIKLPYFDEIELTEKKELYFYTKPKLGERNVIVSINFNDAIKDIITQEVILKLSGFLKNIENIKDYLDKMLEYNFNNGETVDDYINFMINNLTELEIEKYKPSEISKSQLRQAIFNDIHLDKIYINPLDSNLYAYFDYSLIENTSNHIIVFYMRPDGKITGIGIES